MKTKKKKLKSLTKLKKELDKVFSIWIRRRGSDWRGNQVCFTCGISKPWQELQCGHYVSRMHHSLRWDERNCNPQCCSCNVFKHGAMDVYAIKLQAKYGDQILVDLQIEKQKIKQFGRQELSTLIQRYT